MAKTKVIYLRNPLLDPVISSHAMSLSGDYLDEADVLEQLMTGLANQIMEDPDDEFPFSDYDHYHTILRDLLEAILYQITDDPEGRCDEIIADYTEVFCEMHERVYNALLRSYPNINQGVSDRTHLVNITSTRGASLRELEGEEDDLQMLFMPKLTNTRGAYGMPRNNTQPNAGRY